MVASSDAYQLATPDRTDGIPEWELPRREIPTHRYGDVHQLAEHHPADSINHTAIAAAQHTAIVARSANTQPDMVPSSDARHLAGEPETRIANDGNQKDRSRSPPHSRLPTEIQANTPHASAHGQSSCSKAIAIPSCSARGVITTAQVLRLHANRAVARQARVDRLANQNTCSASNTPPRKLQQTRLPLRLAVCFEHPLDKHIEFDEASHTYTLDGIHRFPISVSGVWGAFFQEMDMLATAEKYYPRWKTSPQSIYFLQIQDILESGADDAEAVRAIIESWKAKGRAASERGTYMHRQCELFLNCEECDESLPEMNQFKKFLHEVAVTRDWIPFRTEWSIFDSDRMIAGQIDCIFKELLADRYHMVDFKRCGKPLRPDANACFKQYGLPPCDFLVDNQWSHYTCQQNIYALILKERYNVHLSSMHLLQLHEGQQDYVDIEIPFYESMATEMMDRCATATKAKHDHPC